MNYEAVRALLDTQLTQVVDLPPVQKENTRFTTGGTAWCRSTLMPGEPTALSVGLGGLNEHQGLYQVDVFTPQDDGTAEAGLVAAAVQEQFPRGLILNSGGIQIHVRMAWQQPAYQVEDWYALPVVVRWVAYA